jgi:hypothetical protein
MPMKNKICQSPLEFLKLMFIFAHSSCFEKKSGNSNKRFRSPIFYGRKKLNLENNTVSWERLTVHLEPSVLGSLTGEWLASKNQFKFGLRRLCSAAISDSIQVCHF